MGKTECHCPNCNGPAMKEEDEITCAACDATFTVKQKEVKVKQIGTIEDLSQRVQRLEGLVPDKPADGPNGEKPAPPKETSDDAGDFIVGHGR